MNSTITIHKAVLLLAGLSIVGLCSETSSAGRGLIETTTRSPGNLRATTTKRLNWFDKAVSIAHLRIVKEADEIRNSTTRKQFDISQWTEKANGGLNDQDRAKLGEIYGKATSVFEFGLGESTRIANHVGVVRYAGIDSAAKWVDETRAAVSPHFRFYYADIGETVAWGNPANEKLSKNVMDYQIAALQAEPLPFDVYMVDGRWRLACLLLSFLHASARGAPHETTTVLIHDCYQEGYSPPDSQDRPVYRLADHLLNLVDHSRNKLCVYKRRSNTTDEQLFDLWEQYHTGKYFVQ